VRGARPAAALLELPLGHRALLGRGLLEVLPEVGELVVVLVAEVGDRAGEPLQLTVQGGAIGPRLVGYASETSKFGEQLGQGRARCEPHARLELLELLVEISRAFSLAPRKRHARSGYRRAAGVPSAEYQRFTCF
jgi:hypothetical protein